MKLAMNAKIERTEGGYQIYAEWNKDVKVEADNLADAHQKFDETLKGLGIDKGKVTYQMGI